MGFQNPIVGGTALRIPAIQSPDFQSGVSGWIIRIDGSAEFNDLTIRGEFHGQDFIINSDGIFLYSGTPAAGNLIGSWTSAAGTDGFGNSYSAGLTLYSADGVINFFGTIAQWLSTTGSQISIGVGGGAASAEFLPPSASGVTWQPGSVVASITNLFGAHTARMSITGAYNDAHPSFPTIDLFGSSDSSSSNEVDITTQLCSVSGSLESGNGDHGTAQTPAPGVGGGTSTVAVSFSKTFPNTPRVVISPVTTVDPGTVTIRAYVDSITTTGFTIRNFRSTNSSTNFSWAAVSD